MEESNEAIAQRASQQNQSPSNNIEEINEESAEPSCNIEESTASKLCQNAPLETPEGSQRKKKTNIFEQIFSQKFAF